MVLQLEHFKCFFDTAVSYLDAWGKHTDDLQDLNCLLLKRQPQRVDIEKAVATLQNKCPNVAIDEDVLFDEVSGIQEFLKGGGVLEEWKRRHHSLEDGEDSFVIVLTLKYCTLTWQNWRLW